MAKVTASLAAHRAVVTKFDPLTAPAVSGSNLLGLAFGRHDCEVDPLRLGAAQIGPEAKGGAGALWSSAASRRARSSTQSDELRVDEALARICGGVSDPVRNRRANEGCSTSVACMPTAAPPRGDGGGDRPYVRTAGSSAHVAAARICPLDGLYLNPLDEPLAHPPFVIPPASDCGENLDRQWLISDRGRVHRRATGCALARHVGRLENRGPARRIRAYPPEGAAGAYSGPNGKLPARRLILDVAVRKPKKQNRRRRNSMSVPANAALRGLLLIDALDVDDLLLDPSDYPQNAVPAERLAHGRDALPSEVVLELTIRELDHDRLSRQGTPPLSSEIPASRRRKPPAPTNPSLHEALAHAPLVWSDPPRVELERSRPSVVSDYLGGHDRDVHSALQVGFDSGDDPVSGWSRDRVSHRRRVRIPVELGIPVRVPDDECLARHAPSLSARPSTSAARRSGWRSYVGAGTVPTQRSDQTVSHPPLVLDEKRGSELREPIGRRIVQSPKDRLAILNRESDDEHSRPCDIEPGIPQQPSELEYVPIPHSYAGEHHPGEATYARESASEEGHRQEPGQTGAGVALPESCCATGPSLYPSPLREQTVSRRLVARTRRYNLSPRSRAGRSRGQGGSCRCVVAPRESQRRLPHSDDTYPESEHHRGGSRSSRGSASYPRFP